jgi:photosystem II stability/assembly factor-like uncharacterized protein
MDIYLGTDDGLAVFRGEKEEWRPLYVRLKGQHVTALAVSGAQAWAGTTDGLWRSRDRGATWSPSESGLGVRHVRALSAAPQSPDDPGTDRLWAGTEPAAIWLSHDGGETWLEAPDVARLREAHDWSLPYSPAAGCVRGFALGADAAPDPETAPSMDRLYAAAEVGGVLRSDDAGATWRLLAGGVHADVHDLVTHPALPDWVYAATGGGCYRSRDGGLTWERIAEGYTRAVWLDPDRPETMLVGPARYVGALGRVERSTDGGDTWALASDGFKVPMSDMIERFVSAGSHVLALTSAGELYTAKRGIWMWHPLDLGLSPVRAVAVREG